MSKTSPEILAGELLTSIENGNWSHVRDVLRDLNRANPDAGLATAFYLGQYSRSFRDQYTTGRIGRLLSDDVDSFESPIS